MVSGSRIYKMFHRHPAILIFPFILLFGYMVVQTWPEGDTFEVAPIETLEAPSKIKSAILPHENYAYVFYATSNAYACSALVNIHRLRTLFNSTIPVIMLASSGVSKMTVSVMEQHDIEIIRDKPPPIAPESSPYYSLVLLKLRALRLHQIKPNLKRIQIFDADQLIMKNPESLFELPPVDVAAPLAYWLGGQSATTTLLVVSLSEELWLIVNDAMQHIGKQEYDMDLINRVLKKRLMILPGRYCTLNSHWQAKDVPGWFGGTTETVPATNEQLVELYKQVEILHFTAMGKPWAVNAGTLASEVSSSHAHPIFGDQFRVWRETAKNVCTFDYRRYEGDVPYM